MEPYPKAVPSRLNMTLDPLFDGLDVLVAVFKLAPHMCSVARHSSLDVALLLRLGQGLGPASMLDTGGQVAGKSVLVGSGQVEIESRRFGIEGEEGVHVGNLSGVGVHAASGLSRLDVAPDHGDHVSLVVHEAGVEVRDSVRVGRRDVGRAAREGVLEEVEHGEELARRPVKVLSNCP